MQRLAVIGRHGRYADHKKHKHDEDRDSEVVGDVELHGGVLQWEIGSMRSAVSPVRGLTTSLSCYIAPE